MSDGGGSDGDSLVCPSCGQQYPDGVRFCRSCGLPLTFAGGEHLVGHVSEMHERARKINPQLTEGKLVKVAGASNQAEAEFIQALLLEEGVPSMLRRSAGFDVPDFLAAGPRDVLVPESGAHTAREVLLQAELISADPAPAGTSPTKLMAALMIALALGLLIVWLATSLH